MRTRTKRRTQPFNLENFDEIPEYQEVQRELRKKIAEITKDLEKNYDEIRKYFAFEEDVDEADIREERLQRLQFLPFYAYDEGIGWVVDKEEGWIYDCDSESMTRIPYNEKVVDLIEKSDDLLCQMNEPDSDKAQEILRSAKKE